MLLDEFKNHLEFIYKQLKSTNENSNGLNQHINKIRIDLHQRIELRNNYYHRKFPLLLNDLCLITANKKHFQLIEKQHDRSKQFYQKIFNIQSLIDIDQYHQQYEQSKTCLYQLKTIVQQYENDLEELKQKIIKQNQQIITYSTNLFQIQFEQNQIRSNIDQLNQQIHFEKQFYPIIKYTLKSSEVSNNLEKQLSNEYITLSTQINEIQFNIEQKSIDLLPLQLELYIYHTILNVNDMRLMKLRDQPLLLPTHTEQIQQQTNVMINSIKEILVPIEIIDESESKKGNEENKTLI
jgi:hypothetical protein